MYWLKIVLLSLSRHGPKWYYTNRLMVFHATFNNISVISWQSVLLVEEIGSTRRKPLICRKSLTNFITCYFEYTLPWTGLKLTTLVVTGPYCTSSCKPNYHTTTTMMAPYTDQYKYWWCNQTNVGSASGPYGPPVVKRVGEVRLFGKHFVNKCQNRK